MDRATATAIALAAAMALAPDPEEEAMANAVLKHRRDRGSESPTRVHDQWAPVYPKYRSERARECAFGLAVATRGQGRDLPAALRAL